MTTILLNKKFLFVLFFAFLILSDDKLFSQTIEKVGFQEEPKSNNFTFSKLNSIAPTINQETYFDFIRSSILDQPEFLYANSNLEEKNQSLKFARRQMLPELSLRVINDKIIDRSVADINSLRKRQDDSFDAAVEISQPIYNGGSIRNQIKKSVAEKSVSQIERRNTISQLILDANEIYITAVASDLLYNYAQDLITEITPYLEKVKERVRLGISDPIELAVFSIKYNDLKTKVQLLKTNKNRDKGIFEYFFEKRFENFYLPEISVPRVNFDKNNEAYNVIASRLNHKTMVYDSEIVKGEYRPKFGFNTRYTVYDIDENENDSDIRGGIYFSMPVFSFGRGAARISASKAKAHAYKMNIGIEQKNDENKENQIVNSIENSLNTRNELYNSFIDTKNQVRIIKNRLDSTNFSAQAYVDSAIQETNLLERILSTEVSLLHGYMLYLHQNQNLNNILRIDL
jgi:hypothetical protein